MEVIKSNKEVLPTRVQAEKILAEAELSNPGLWGNHSRNVAKCAERIAIACNLDSEKSYIFGLLHDIGRKFGIKHLGHVYDGYKYMQKLGYPSIAKICLTHSFCIKDINSYIGNFDIEEAEIDELKTALDEIEYDIYDKLIQLCDALGSSDGIVNIEKRMQDVKDRYGSYPQDKWDKNIELKEYFENLTNQDIFTIVCKD